MNRDVIPFKNFRKGFRHPIRFRTLDRREAGNQSQAEGMGLRLMSGIPAPIIREPFEAVRRPGDWAEASLDRFNHDPGPSPHLSRVDWRPRRTSRSHVSNTKATRMASPFQQGISNTSEHQRLLEHKVMTCPSCAGCCAHDRWSRRAASPVAASGDTHMCHFSAAALWPPIPDSEARRCGDSHR